MPSDAVTVRPMVRAELDVLVAWAAAEGWNPGRHDADAFWAADPEGFVAAEVAGAMVGGGSIVAYGRAFGFMGFFIVKPELRHGGIGARLWHARKAMLLARLDPGAPIGMDGVPAMQDFYARGGFRFSHRDVRYVFAGRRAGAQPSTIVELHGVPFDDVVAYDARHFPARRPEFLRRWLAPPAGRAVAAVRGSKLAGYGVLRRCREGFKVGPLFAADAELAEALLGSLVDAAPGEAVYLDVPERNQAAVELARRWEMREVFSCARMYLGEAPDLPHEQIFGVTTFELG